MLNAYRAIKRFEQNVILKKATINIVNHKPQTTYSTNIDIKAVVKPTNLMKANIERVDYSLEYKTFHSLYEISMNDVIIHNSKSYKIVQSQDYSDYNYYKAIGEEVK